VTIYSQSNKGFTVIELFIVIALLGLLAVTALPKFSYVSKVTQKNSANATAAILQTAINNAHTHWQATGHSAIVTLEDNTHVGMSITGWPECIAANSCKDAGMATAEKCHDIWAQIMINPPLAKAAPCLGICQYLITANHTSCNFQDEQGKGNNTIIYNMMTGDITVASKNSHLF